MNIQDSFQRAVLENLRDGVYFVDRSRTITYWNKAAEVITGFEASEVVGSHCMDNILNHVDGYGHSLCFGECPLSDVLNDGEEREETIYLHHKNGHRVAVDVRVIPIKDDNEEITGAVEIFMESAEEALPMNNPRSLDEEALLDPVTSLWNPQYSETILNTRLEEMKQYGRKFGVLLIDIDRFETIQQSFGEEISNQVLQMAAATILNSLRPYDFLSRSRYGDFMAFVTNTNESELKRIAERVRVLVEHSSLFRYADPIKVTVSIGATLARPGDKAEALLDRTGQLMQQSKQAGRNRLTMEKSAQTKPHSAPRTSPGAI